MFTYKKDPQALNQADTSVASGLSDAQRPVRCTSSFTPPPHSLGMVKKVTKLTR